MSEEIFVESGLSKEDTYRSLIPQIRALCDGEVNRISVLGNIMAALKYSMDFWWVGLYIVKNNRLELDVFQGPVACSTIQKGKGVCGTSWDLEKVIIVEDVDRFPGHIACSSESRSEIVIPGRNKKGEVTFVLDVDSQFLAAFDKTDEKFLTEIVSICEPYFE